MDFVVLVFIAGIIVALLSVWAWDHVKLSKRVKFLEDQNDFFHEDIASLWRSHFTQSDELRRYADDRFNELEVDTLGKPTKNRK